MQLIELRLGEALWATLSEDEDGKKQLDLAPSLTSDQINSYKGGLALCDSTWRPLIIGQDVNNSVYIKDHDGNKVLMLRVGINDEIVDILHPLVKLVVVQPATRGSTGNDPARFGRLMLGLRWK